MCPGSTGNGKCLFEMEKCESVCCVLKAAEHPPYARVRVLFIVRQARVSGGRSLCVALPWAPYRQQLGPVPSHPAICFQLWARPCARPSHTWAPSHPPPCPPWPRSPCIVPTPSKETESAVPTLRLHCVLIKWAYSHGQVLGNQHFCTSSRKRKRTLCFTGRVFSENPEPQP